jgi:hypothetical protein
MRARTLLSITVGIALAAAAVLATVAPANAAPTKKGQTVVTLDADAAGVITGLGVAVAPTGPASADGLAFTFPIVGRTGDAVIQHVGGLSLTADETVVTLSNFWIDTNADAGVVSGIVDDVGRVPLFTLGAETADGLELLLTVEAAEYLNATFDVDTFGEGLLIGYGAPAEIS